jgi:hypothetical protein
LAEEGENILQLAGLDDTSLTNYLSVASGHTIKDMVLYEMNNRKALLYIIDSGDEMFELNPDMLTNPTDYPRGTGGMYAGFKMLGSTDDDIAIEMDYPVIVNTSISVGYTTEGNSIDDGTNFATKLAQPINTDDMVSRKLDRVGMVLVNVQGTGAGVTLKLSIQTDADRDTSPYSYQGAWVISTGYSLYDTVTQGAVTFVCIQAHTSSAGNQPEVGSGTEDYWQRFGAPSGTEVASATVDASTITENTVNLPPLSASSKGNIATFKRTWFEFSSQVSLDTNTHYWLVLEEQGSNMTSANQIGWMTTQNDGQTYEAVGEGISAKLFSPTAFGTNPGDTWLNPNTNDQGQEESRDFAIGLTRLDDWSLNLANGSFGVDTGQESFLFASTNALLYWFVGNRVHAFDGGITGGSVGRANKNLLQFPSYLQVVDVDETRSRMYIGLDDATSTSDDKFRNSREVGVFVWDKRSQVFGSTDFYPAMGAKSIKKVFKSSVGDVKIISVSNSGFGEIRGIDGNQYGVIHTFEKDGYPVSRNSVTQLDNMTIWTGKNGIKYAYGAIEVGEPEQLYKIGTEAGEYGDNPVQGAMFVGNENTSTLQSAVLTAWKDDAGNYVQKWYPHGEGTINTVAQKALIGNVYTKVYEFASPMHVVWGHLNFLPIIGGDATEVATVKVYYNKSTTVGATFVMTAKELAKGYKYMPLGEKNVYAIQFEIEWNTSQTLGSFDLQPSSITVDYKDYVTKKK